MNMPVAFAQLTKIDVEKRLVYGRAAQETPDHSGEVMDYLQSKPNFIAWSDGMNKATGGMSQGNIRAMHGQVAAGKVQELLFNDEECAVDVVAKIVDDNEWQKCLEGVYTGFSIGGKYGARVTKGDFKHYEAIPSEISLVDRPCIPTATFFDIQKSDGSVMRKSFQTSGDQIMPATLAKSTDESNELNADAAAVDVAKSAEEIEYQVEGTAEDADALAKLLHDNKLSIGDAVKAVQAATEAPLIADLAKRYEGDEVEPEFMAELLALEKIAARADVSPKEGESKYGDVKFADEKNNKYPIENEAHIRAAWNYINKEKNAAKYSAEDLASIKGKIVAAWKAKIDKAGPPAAEKVEVAGDLGKGIADVAQLGQMLQALYYCAQSCKAESAREGDNSDIPARLSAVAQTVAQIYKDMATEEADELVEDMGEGETNEVMQMAYSLAGSLAKAGARNSATDADMLQKMHDLSSKLGANCAAEAVKAEEVGDLAKDKDALGHGSYPRGETGASLSVQAMKLSDIAHSSVGTAEDHYAAGGAHLNASEHFKAENKLSRANAAEALAQDHFDIAHEMETKAGKSTPAGDLTKAEPAPDLTKMISDAMEPLNKALGDAMAKIAKLEAQPLPAKGVLRVVSKENDLVTEVKKVEIAPVVERDGSENAAATMFKKIHASGGAPLVGGMR